MRFLPTHKVANDKLMRCLPTHDVTYYPHSRDQNAVKRGISKVEMMSFLVKTKKKKDIKCHGNFSLQNINKFA